MAPRIAWPERALQGIALLTIAGMGAGLASCGLNDDEECLHPPCPLPQAIRLSITAAGGGAVEGVVVRTSGAATGTGSCRTEATATTCSVMGYPGVYELEVSAGGFQTQRRSVTVTGVMPECGCPTIATVDLQLVFTPIPPTEAH